MLRIIRRQSIWVLALGLGLGAAGLTRAADEKVEIDQVPKLIRHKIDEATKGASKIVITSVPNVDKDLHDYMVHYVDASGKEMKLRVGPTGRVLEQGETVEQLHKDQEQQLKQFKSDAERAKYQENLAAQRDKEDRQRYDAYNADASRETAQGHQEYVDRTYLGLRAMSEEYNSTDRRRIAYNDLPQGARKTFDMETNQLKNIDYFQYTVGGVQFYSVHYNVGDIRMVARVDHTGILLGKNELRPAPAVVIEDHYTSLPAEGVPPNIMQVIRREAQGDRDFSYFRVNRGDEIFFSAHYTTPANHRMDLWMEPDGDVVIRRPTALQPGDHNFKYEWGG